MKKYIFPFFIIYLLFIQSAFSQNSTTLERLIGDNIIKISTDSDSGTTIDKGYYVAIFSAGQKMLALEKMSELKNNGIETKLFYNKSNYFHYVYSHYYQNLSDAFRKADEMKLKGCDKVKIIVF